MPHSPILRSFTIAALLLVSAGPANAFMIRPELGMGMTDYLSQLSKECPETKFGSASALKWRPGMPCPTVDGPPELSDSEPVEVVPTGNDSTSTD